MQSPDTFAPVTSMGEIESRIGLPPLETLLAERGSLIEQCAPLRAVYGPGGTFEARRKILLATIAQRLRAEAVRDSVKRTEAATDDLAHADDAYAAFVTKATTERTALAVLEDQISGIGDTIRRGDAVCKYVTAEVGLSR